MIVNKELIKLINEWLYHNNKMKEINSYIFNHPELFEQKYQIDFQDSLFRFFAGKITRYSTDFNKIHKLLTKEQSEELNKIKLYERR